MRTILLCIIVYALCGVVAACITRQIDKVTTRGSFLWYFGVAPVWIGSQAVAQEYGKLSYGLVWNDYDLYFYYTVVYWGAFFVTVYYLYRGGGGGWKKFRKKGGKLVDALVKKVRESTVSPAPVRQ